MANQSSLVRATSLLEKIDVVMCTYNSNRPYFHAVLQRISEEIPVHCLILVDRYSSDKTVDKVLETFPKAKVVLSRENLGRARKIGIDNVDTPLFAFVDDDVLLLKGWYKFTKGLMGNRIGAVACFARKKSPLTRGIYYYSPHMHVCALGVSSKNNVDSQRGFTNATLMKKESVTTWKPDKTLAAWEDHEMLRHVVRNGFLWLTSYSVFAEHLQPDQNCFSFFRDIWRNEAWNTAGGRYTRAMKFNPAQLVFRSLLKFWTGFKISILFRNPFAFLYYLVDGLADFYGYTCWRKNLFLQR